MRAAGIHLYFLLPSILRVEATGGASIERLDAAFAADGAAINSGCDWGDRLRCENGRLNRALGHVYGVIGIVYVALYAFYLLKAWRQLHGRLYQNYRQQNIALQGQVRLPRLCTRCCFSLCLPSLTRRCCVPASVHVRGTRRWQLSTVPAAWLLQLLPAAACTLRGGGCALVPLPLVPPSPSSLTQSRTQSLTRGAGARRSASTQIRCNTGLIQRRSDSTQMRCNTEVMQRRSASTRSS